MVSLGPQRWRRTISPKPTPTTAEMARWTANRASEEPRPTRVATVGSTPRRAMAAPKASPPTTPAGAPAATARAAEM